MTNSIWLCYDLGVDGDYESLYLWLDNKGAKECGDSIAYFKYAFKADMIKELSEEIKKNVKFRNRDRVYIIYHSKNVTHGKFLIGGRKRAPWEGYKISDEDFIDE